MSAFTDSTATEITTTLRNAGCVFAEDETRLLLAAARTPNELTNLVDQRAAGTPLEYILGWADFCGLRIAVEPAVFVPRRRTEFLVHQAAALAPRNSLVVDLCCGTGAVGSALATLLANIELHAADIDPAAVRCARRNITTQGHVHEGDLCAALPTTLRGRVDVLVVNAPYVPTEAIATMPPEARLHEPNRALDGGSDGLDVHRKVSEMAPQWLAPGGHLLVESSEQQVPRLIETFTRHGLHARTVTSDEFDATLVIGTSPAGSGNRSH
ncbi:putative protein N(5)-glutamine methyltransferase [Parasphingorhabdus pacifica]